MQSARTAEKGHGRIEIRELASTTALAGHLEGWADVCQVFMVMRRRTEKGETTEEVAYGITSLTRAEADAGALLGLVRGHWGIENGLHWVRDVTMGEDGCRVRKGGGAQVLAALRNVAAHLLEEVEAKSKAGARRELAGAHGQAVALFKCN